MERGESFRQWAAQVYAKAEPAISRELDRGMSDARIKLVEEGWTGKQQTESVSSISPSSYDSEPITGQSLEEAPELDLGVTPYEQTFGPAPSREDIYGTPMTSGVSAETDIPVESESPEPEIEPEM